MVLLYWVAAAWLAAATLITLAFLGARRSHRLHGWLFGEMSADVRRLTVVAPARVEPVTRLAA